MASVTYTNEDIWRPHYPTEEEIRHWQEAQYTPKQKMERLKSYIYDLSQELRLVGAYRNFRASSKSLTVGNETVIIKSDAEKRQCVFITETISGGITKRVVATYQCHIDKPTTYTYDYQDLWPKQSDDVEIDRTFKMQMEG